MRAPRSVRVGLTMWVCEGRAGGFQDALSIVAGLGRKDVELSGSAVLDIVTDLRGAQRMMDRGVRKVLTEEQVSILDRD